MYRLKVAVNRINNCELKPLLTTLGQEVYKNSATEALLKLLFAYNYISIGLTNLEISITVSFRYLICQIT